jgi:peptidoglycan hydrolase-like protein with peptidoglycan-binding domain
MTLVATQPFSGVVASSDTWMVGRPSGSSPNEVAAAVDAEAEAIAQLTAARSAVTAAEQVRSLVLARDAAAIGVTPAGSARVEATRMRTLDRIEQDGAVAAARVARADAERALAAAQRDLAARHHDEARGGVTITTIPAVGTALHRGEALYALDGQSTILVIGDTPFWRALREGDAGPDVAELQANLVALGMGGTPQIRTDGTFDHPTALAVTRWQTALHVPATGIVRLGDVVVLPAEVRVVAAHVAVGGGAPPGNPILDGASLDEVIKVELEPGQSGVAHPGDSIRFTAPDGGTIPGQIISVGAPEMSADTGGNGPPPHLVVNIVARPDDPAAIAALEGASLTAEITTDTAADALVVPVAALVVLADGGFGVEVAGAGATHFVRVTPGIYDRTMVAITGSGIAVGDQVVVPGA